MKAQNYTATKKKGGYITVREYNIEYCYNAGADLIVNYKGKEMTIKNADLKNNGVKVDNSMYQSHYKNSKHQSYGVRHFRWIPDDEKDNQMTLF